MYGRIITPPIDKSFFLFGPRGTGKSSWVRTHFAKALFFDLLESDIFTQLLASPQRLDAMIPKDFKDWVVIDEIQKIPFLLDEVHRLIENRHLKFVLTGSSSRKLRQKGINLLAGRALSYALYPLTAIELDKDFDLKHSLKFGHLPGAYVEKDPHKFLKTYIATYIKEEVQQEGLTRNIAAFARFLEAASFSQGNLINASAVAKDCSVERKVVEDYFSILEDLLLAFRLPVFSKRAKRKLVSHSKFYFFDAGVFRAIRPLGPLDSSQELNGAALETLIIQEIRALNDYSDLGYSLHFWRTLLKPQLEVDIVLYGKRGLKAIEVKASSKLRDEDFRSLMTFKKDYPIAETFLIYSGEKSYFQKDVKIIPAADFLKNLSSYL